MNNHIKRISLPLVTGVLLSACGGGGGDEASTNSATEPVSAKASYTVNVSSNGQGQILPTTNTVQQGNSLRLNITASLGHELTDIFGCGGSLDGSVYVIPSITEDCEVTGEFQIQSFVISTKQNGEGEIYPNSPILDWGTEQTFNLNPADGFQLGKVSGCSGTLENNKYIIPAVSADCTVKVDFNPLKVQLKNDALDQKVELNVKGNAGISPTSKGILKPGDEGAPPIPSDIELPFLVNDVDLTTEQGATVELDIVYEKPLPEVIRYYKFGPSEPGAEDSWYELPRDLYTVSADRKVLTLKLTDGQIGDADWEVNGLIQDPGGPGVPNQYEVTLSASEGGTSDSLNQLVYHGEVGTFNLIPNTGFHVSGVEGCEGTLAGNTYTTAVITTPCEIMASFSLNQYQLSTTSTEGGSLEAVDSIIGHGQPAQVNIIPEPGFTLSNIAGCDGNQQNDVFVIPAMTSNCEVAASFELIQFQINARASVGGLVSPTTQSVQYGDSATYTLTPDTGYSIGNINGCSGTLSGNTFVTDVITETCNLNVTFDLNHYTVRGSAGPGGSISSESQSIGYGQSATLTVTPETGYSINVVEGCAGTLSGNTFTTAAVTQACHVSATFSLDHFDITTSAEEGGAITPQTQSVAYGEVGTLTVTPEVGYGIDVVSGCGGTLTGNTFVTGTMTEACHVNATFSLNHFDITSSVSEGGSITPQSQSIGYGQSASFIVTPDTGYNIDSVQGCSGTLTGNTFLINDVQTACHVEATFSLKRFEVTGGAATGGAITPETQTANYGQTTTLTVTPNVGYSIDAVEGCNGTLVGNTYTTGIISKSCHVNATFSLNHFDVTGTASKGGAIIPSNQSIGYGSTATFTLIPEEGYSIDSVEGCNGALSGNIFITESITESCAVYATFSLAHFSVTSSAGEGGGVTPQEQSIAYGQTAQVAVTPDVGYSIDLVEGCNGALDGSIFTTGAINDACHINADFSLNHYAVSVSATNGGQISGSTNSIPHGQSATFTLTPETGYSIADVEGCNGVLSGNTYVTGALSSACHINASFSLNNYPVSTAISPGGSISPQIESVAHGSTTKFTLAADEGYSIVSVVGCEGTLNGNVFTTSAVTSVCEVTANFELNKHVISTQNNNGGQISPLSSTVDYGTDSLFTITPEAGYSIASVTGCGGTLIDDKYRTGKVTSDCEITASFSLNHLTVTSSANKGGNITPSMQSIGYGQSATLTVTPDTGYSIESVQGCGGTLSGNTFAIGELTEACHVTATFSLDHYMVSGLAGAGGAITPTTQRIGHGQTTTLTVTPEMGYSIDSVQGCGGRLSGNSFTTGAVTEACTVTASFSLNHFAVTSSANEGGNITPSTQSIGYGQSATLTVTPDTGYSIESVQGCNGTLSGNTFAIGEVTEACHVTATFSLNYYMVSGLAGAGGAITPTTQRIGHGQTTTLTVTPETGYSIDSVQGCGGDSLSGNTFTTGSVTEACTVTASFSLNHFAVTSSANEGGHLTPSTQSIGYGQSATLTVTPDTGYSIESVQGCGGTLNGNTFVIGEVTEACHVTAAFSLKQYMVSGLAGAGGAITPTTQRIGHGQTTTLTVTPETGYSIDSVKGCGGSLSGNTFTTGSVTEACTVTASFSVSQFAVTSSANEGGNISPEIQSINYGQRGTFTITPNAGYKLNAIQGCNGRLIAEGGITLFETDIITQACHVYADFSAEHYTLTTSSSAGGSISPVSQLMTYGQSIDLNIMKYEGYSIDSITSTCAESERVGDSFSVYRMVASCNVHVEFKIEQRIVSTRYTEGGVLTPSSKVLNYGESASFNIIPQESYELSSISGCGGRREGNIYHTGRVQESCQVTANFRLKNHIINILPVLGGSISYGSNVNLDVVTVEHGRMLSFDLIPNEGYEVEEVTGCNGELVPVTNEYHIAAITGSCSISARFKKKTFTIAATVDEAGEIFGESSQQVNFGEQAVFTFNAEEGYEIRSVEGCNGVLLGWEYLTAPIYTACTVKAHFQLKQYDVTVEKHLSSGEIIKEIHSAIEHGSRLPINIQPGNGEVFVSVQGCNGALQEDTYNTGPITQACKVEVIYEPETYLVSITTDGHGEVTPKEQEVAYKKVGAFTVKPNSGFELMGVTGCEEPSIGSNYLSLFASENCTAHVEFGYRISATITGGFGKFDGYWDELNFQKVVKPNTLFELPYIRPTWRAEIKSVTGCGATLNRNGNVSIEEVTESCDLTIKTGPVLKAPHLSIQMAHLTKKDLNTLSFLPRTIGDTRLSYDLYISKVAGVTPDNYKELGAVKITQVPYVERTPPLSTYIAFETLQKRGITGGTYVSIVETYGDDVSEPSNEVEIYIPSTLNDTGVVSCIDTTQVSPQGFPLLDCGLAQEANGDPALRGQDAHLGRDAQAVANTLTKQGAGKAGFDFTKLDSNGEELPSDAAQWSCVKDNQTGLIWESKTESSGIHNRRNTFFRATFWHGEFVLDGDCVESSCNVLGLVHALNVKKLCGYDDWRLPLVPELQGLVDYGMKADGAMMIDESFFPNTVIDGGYSGTYLADALEISRYVDSIYYLIVDFSTGEVRSQSSKIARARLVRSAKRR
ncbi:hypothetical protein N473_10855 [Pseudoalteromonas luteoviolacea CPMOR-1]|uniref:Bacterial repeat domain-containing protein n=1 Tax=Pseudoalteromonas luteoviolacea CPMOR-1 TaxID=1365248 RepID=A0A162B3W2_9GAMM|nr:choice-of-anchor U domain-containing protein [Pseudoalteromonas luteoviolacea]KZN66060.1 hypothetical protein N473_10855 [Pseudoalteromonas luteoviolacea CPMOR-1]